MYVCQHIRRQRYGQSVVGVDYPLGKNKGHPHITYDKQDTERYGKASGIFKTFPWWGKFQTSFGRKLRQEGVGKWLKSRPQLNFVSWGTEAEGFTNRHDHLINDS